MDIVNKKHNANAGQLTWVSIIGVFVSFIVLLVLFPVLDDFVESTIVRLGAGSEYTPLISTLLRLVLVMLPIAMIISIINQANPPRGYA
jgi:uncharacterized protein YqhQ